MALRMTEEEYAELRRRYQQRTRDAEAKERAQRAEGNPASRGAAIAKRKYRNERVTIDGKTFDSKHEAEVYGELLIRWRAGELKLLCRQVPFDLPGGIRYVADFVIVTADGEVQVIDAKSPITRKNRVYINKKKQLRELWHIEITEV